jgi:hypothetical protein
MKNLKSTFTIAFAMLFISAMSFTSCGGKKEANNETDTEQAEGGEHPAAANSTEHPTDN